MPDPLLIAYGLALDAARKRVERRVHHADRPILVIHAPMTTPTTQPAIEAKPPTIAP